MTRNLPLTRGPREGVFLELVVPGKKKSHCWDIHEDERSESRSGGKVGRGATSPEEKLAFL